MEGPPSSYISSYKNHLKIPEDRMIESPLSRQQVLNFVNNLDRIKSNSRFETVNWGTPTSTGYDSNPPATNLPSLKHNA